MFMCKVVFVWVSCGVVLVVVQCKVMWLLLWKKVMILLWLLGWKWVFLLFSSDCILVVMWLMLQLLFWQVCFLDFFVVCFCSSQVISVCGEFSGVGFLLIDRQVVFMGQVWISVVVSWFLFSICLVLQKFVELVVWVGFRLKGVVSRMVVIGRGNCCCIGLKGVNIEKVGGM